MNNKIFLIMFCMVLLVGTVSASEWDNLKTYDKETETITVYNWNIIGLAFDLKIRQDTLTFNSYGCLTDCSAEGTTILYDEGALLFDGIEFRNQDRVKKNKTHKFFIEFNETFNVEVPTYEEVCDYHVNESLEGCYQNQTGTKILERSRIVWKEYKGEVLEVGTYKWRIEGKKKIGENIDWVVNTVGKEYTEWAWWNTSYGRCRTFQLQNASSGARTEQPLTYNLTGLTSKLANNNDVRLVNASCINDGTEQERTIVDSGSNYATTAFTFTGNYPINWSVYYDNNSIIDTPTNESALAFYDEFNDGSLDTNKWTLSGDASTLFSNGIMDVSQPTGPVIGITSDASFDEDNYIQIKGKTNQSFAGGRKDLYLFSIMSSSTQYNYGYFYDDANDNKITIISRNAGDIRRTEIRELDNEWHEFWVNTSGTDGTFWVNETLNATVPNLFATVHQLSLLFNTGSGGEKYAQYDWVRMWNNSVTFYSDVPVLTIFAEQVDITPPEVNLLSPVNEFNSSNPILTFILNVTDAEGITNVSLFLNGIINETNSSGINNANYTFVKTLTDGKQNWTAEVCDTDDGCVTATTRNFTVDTTNPLVKLLTPPVIVSSHVINTNLTITWSVNDTNLDTCIFEYEGVNRTVTCSDNSTQINITNTINRTVILYVNDSVGLTNSSTRSWNYTIFENPPVFNATALETDQESFLANITTNGTVPTDASLIYAGTEFTSATITNIGSNTFEISREITIPASTGSKSFNFNFTFGGTETSTTTQTQTVNLTNYTQCDSGNVYLNFTFKNETISEEDITATFSSSWEFWLGDGSIRKTLSFSNATENPFYAFCLTGSNRTLTTNVSLTYNNVISQQRTLISPFILSNLTVTNKVLYLLPTSLGLFSQFRTESTLGATITNVIGTITRTLGGVPITVAVSSTDGSGLAVFFLNPDVTYNALFSKTGFIDNSFSFIPVTDLRTVIMATTTGISANGTEISLNTTYQILPLNSSLNNNTNVIFSFQVNSSQNITLISMNITNSTGHQLLFQNSTSVGTLSGVVNTSDNTRIFGLYIIQTEDETITLTRVWIVGPEFAGDYSLFRQMQLFLEYGFNPFLRILIVLITIFSLVMFVSSKSEVIDEEIKLALVITLVWAFSFVGWLDTGIAVTTSTSSLNVLTQFSNQYGIAILTTGIGVYFILRRVFSNI